MSPAPRLSIGLPVYNAEEALTESLEALLGQSYPDFELIISDNASTDGTADLCRRYAKQDSRIRYLRQPRNIGRVPNHNFVIDEARGELFKWAAGDDLYARDLLRRCVDALDARPEVVLAHTQSAIVDKCGRIMKLVDYPPATDAPRAPDRFRSMLFDGWGDDSYGVIRTAVLRRTPLHGSYLNADRTFSIEIALHGPFYQVPERLFFRRDAPAPDTPFTVRTRCAYMDPRRADRLRHPAARLYGEYGWAYIAMIRRAPLSAAERLECYRYLAEWCARRALPLANRILHHRPLPFEEIVPDPPEDLARQSLPSVSALVPGRDRRTR
jgi:glycosyltransferase involved in cell wall biosynthesis